MRLTLWTFAFAVSACSEGATSSAGAPVSAADLPVSAPSSAVTSTADPTSTAEASGDGSPSTTGESSSDSTTSVVGESSNTTFGESAPMRGALSFHVEPLGDCSLGDTWFDYPIVEGGHPVTATEHATLSEDNGPGVPGSPLHVTCEWLTTGEPFRLVLGIEAFLGEDRRTASVSPVLEPTKPNTGAFSFVPTDGGPSWGPPDLTMMCEYTQIEVDDTRQSIWGRITCPSISHRDSAETCRITEGYFYFENCRPRML